MLTSLLHWYYAHEIIVGVGVIAAIPTVISVALFHKDAIEAIVAVMNLIVFIPIVTLVARRSKPYARHGAHAIEKMRTFMSMPELRKHLRAEWRAMTGRTDTGEIHRIHRKTA